MGATEVHLSPALDARVQAYLNHAPDKIVRAKRAILIGELWDRLTDEHLFSREVFSGAEATYALDVLTSKAQATIFWYYRDRSRTSVEVGRIELRDFEWDMEIIVPEFA